MTTTATGGFGVGFRRGWSDWQKDTAGWVAWAKARGFACLDIAGNAEAASAVLDAGLAVGTADLLDFKGLVTGDAAQRAAAVRANTLMIDQLTALGVTRFFTVMLPADATLKRGRIFELAVEGYRPVVERLAQRGGKLAIEGWPGPGAVCCTPETYRAFIAAFDKQFPGVVGINYDPSHLLRMNIDAMRFLREFVGHVVHVHGKDTQIDHQAMYELGTEQGHTLGQAPGFGGTFWRYTIPGHGCFAWTPAFEVLKDAGYDGYVSIELEDCRYNGSEDGEKRGLLLSRDNLASF